MIHDIEDTVIIDRDGYAIRYATDAEIASGESPDGEVYCAADGQAASTRQPRPWGSDEG